MTITRTPPARTPNEGGVWHATVLAAVGLAVSEPAAEAETARKCAVARVRQEMAG